MICPIPEADNYSGALCRDHGFLRLFYPDVFSAPCTPARSQSHGMPPVFLPESAFFMGGIFAAISFALVFLVLLTVWSISPAQGRRQEHLRAESTRIIQPDDAANRWPLCSKA